MEWDWYIGYLSWFLKIGTEGCDDLNITNGDGWNQTRSSQRSEPLDSLNLS